MSDPLPLRPTPLHRETVPSYLSRMAAMNGVSSTDFAVDMGFSIKRILNLEEGAVRRFAELGGLDEHDLEKLVSWTGRAIGNVRIAFRGEVFVSRALRNPQMRGCPACLREDARGRAPLEAMAMRGDWQFREVGVCVRHGQPLAQIWELDRPTERHDIASRLREIEAAILSGALDRPSREPTPYDLWLDRRLEDGRDPTWLAGHALFAATTFCRLLGTELLRIRREPDLDEERRLSAAQAAGFDVARRGEDAINAALAELAAAASGYNDTPAKAFGRLLTKLRTDYLHEEAFEPFRHLVRERILARWPVAAGETVLGMTLPERRLHSLYTAAKEAGIGTRLLEPFLVEAGALSPHDKRSANLKIFDAQRYGPLLAEIPTLVGPREMRKVMGTTLAEWNSLVKDGVLVPRRAAPKIDAPWRLADGLSFLAELQAKALLVEADDPDWENIQRAKGRSGIGVGVIIDAVRKGWLRLGQRRHAEGYAAFVVSRHEIDLVAKLQARETNETVPAAEFGRQVGLRGRNGFLALVKAGHTPAIRMKHPVTGTTWFYLSDSDVVAFHKKFLTSTTMAQEFQEHRRTLLAKLEAAGVSRFAPAGENYGNVFLREDVEAALRSAF